MRILIVDDQADLRDLQGLILRGVGHETVEAPDGLTALSMLRADPSISMVVLDVQMPDVTGWEVLRAIRFDEATRDVPVVICTVKSGLPDLDAAWRLETDGYVTKPFDPAQLISAVSTAASRRELQSSENPEGARGIELKERT